MSYTYPDGQPQGKALRFANQLREIMIAEIYAINGYQSHIADSNIEEINTAWQHIMQDEKNHYGQILQLLRKYDPEQAKQFANHKKDSPGKAPLHSFSPPENYAVLNNIREDVKGEMEAVILYEELILKFPYEDARRTLRSIIDEEKGHAEHLTRLLLKFDPDKYNGLA